MNSGNNAPLPERMRPRTLEEFFGQEEVVGKDSFMRRAIERDDVPSLILWGPPGSGKTTLAHIIAAETKARFVRISAVESGKAHLREVIAQAKENSEKGTRTILFIDEIHRWNKAQQDALLPHLEDGTITLIGATTENPGFEVVGALLSRARVVVLGQLSSNDIEKILLHALSDKERGLGKQTIRIEKDAVKMIADLSNGDARSALATLEAATRDGRVTKEEVKKILQKSSLFYDKDGEERYNIISALHKSMRGGDADASVYYTVRMLEGGENPLYIARRFVRFASEDIGLANNTALLLANSVFDACYKLGMPECGVHLAHCAAYFAKSKKSIAAYEAYESAKKDVAKFGNLPVPMHIRNAPVKLMKTLGYGKGYKYTPKEDSSKQEYLPEELRRRKYLGSL